jgi:transposase
MHPHFLLKKNIANRAKVVKNLLKKWLKISEYLKTYFMRNLSEAAFSADKRRFG